MNHRATYLLLCLVLVGCGVSNIDRLDPADPALIKKLGISEQEWHAIRQLSPERNGLIVKSVGQVAPDEIEIEFKEPDDRENDQGGPADRYEKKDGQWKRE